MIFQQIRNKVKPGTRLPRTNYAVKGLGKRRGEAALIYCIPNKIAPGKHYEKGVTESEFERAYAQLVGAGDFSRTWFNENLSSATDSPCSFMVIGKIFLLLGIADYERGRFTRRANPSERKTECRS
jgi:hypothetical protein